MPPQSQCRRMRYHRRVSEQDRWLDEKGLYRKHIVTDASCLFRIVSEHVYKIQSYHEKVRSDCVQYMVQNEDSLRQLVEGAYKEYVDELSKPGTHGGLIDITVMSQMYNYDFVIYDNGKGPETYVSNGHCRMILLYHIKEKRHFDVLYSKEYMSNISFCQSLLYSILYKDVYKMIDVDYAVKKMLYGKENSSIDYYMPESVLRRTSNQLSKLEANNISKKCDGTGDECDNDKGDDCEVINFTIFPMDSGDSIMIVLDTSNAKEMLDNKILPFPYKVAKALDPNIYRNIELDSWYELKKDEQPSGQYFDGLSLQVGVKCLCSLNPNSGATYHCHIQDMKGEDGPCVVFVEELGEMRTVSMNQLKPLPAEEAKPWYTPYKKERAKFYSIAGILRQLGYIGITNNCKFKYKLKKAGGIGQELAQLKDNIDWMNNKVGDKGDRYIRRFDLFNYPSMEEKTTSVGDNSLWDEESLVHGDNERVDSQYYDCIERCTKMDMSNFQPYKVEMITMPLVVEQNNCSTSATADSTRDSSTTNPRPASIQSTQHEQTLSNLQYPVQTSNGNELSPSPGFVSTTPITGTPVSLSAIATHSGSSFHSGMVWSSGNAAMYNTYPIYCTPPHGAALAPPPPPPPSALLHPPMLLPRVVPLPTGVNICAQRSMDVNGSDLPYNDISTLRYFFNLGIEYMYACKGWTLPPPLPHMPMHTIMAPGVPPPNTPSPSNYTHTPSRVSPNQIAIELQHALTLEDSTTSTQDSKEGTGGNNNNHSSKNNANMGNIQQKGKGCAMDYGGSNGGRRGGMGGGYGGRYRGGNGGNNHKNNYGRNNYYRNNTNHNSNMNNNSNHSNNMNKSSNNHHSKGNPTGGDAETNSANAAASGQHQDSHTQPTPQDNTYSNSQNVPFISFPPPPFYRMPFYPVDGDGTMLPMGYGHVPFTTMPEDTVSSTSETSFINPGPPPYLSYIPTPPPMYYQSVPPTYGNYNPSHFTPMTPDNSQSK